ncbi:hypothetical protein SAMN05720759_103346 [Fibrobacter sp. UWB12]|nr:hypothetical protein SAMN05720759_103346 [Fibrobacter sp. UWB12]
MERKKFIPLLLSSAMAFLWACGEGSINEVTDVDERAKANLLEKLDSTKKDYEKNVHEFVDKFLEYCNGKEGHKDGCEAEYKKSSSSKGSDGGSASSNSSSSTTSKSSSSGKTNSSSSNDGKSSPSGSSSSSKPVNSSSSGASSSSAKLKASGECVLTMPDVVYIGDQISWRYVPDEGSLEEAEFTWSFNDDDAKNWVVDGKVSGTGTPELFVTFKSKGTKVAPTLTFDGKGFECKNVKVAAKDDPVSSSSEPESSSSEPESSSAQSSSSVKGYCAVSKRKIFTGEMVDWYIVDVNGNELSGVHQWVKLGDDTAELIDGERSGSGSTRIQVKYTRPNSKVEPMVTWNGKTVSCDRNELDEDDFDALLVVETLPESSSSEEVPEESSSSEEEEKSSSSKAVDPCLEDPESCIF